MTPKTKKLIKLIAAYLVILLLLGVAYYVTLPALHPAASDFWISLAVVIFALTLPIGSIRFTEKPPYNKSGSGMVEFSGNKWLLLAAIAPIAIYLLLTLISSPVFNAKRYASVITVADAVFEEDMPKTDAVTNIALMDSASAEIVGNRTLGSLSDVISQYEIAPSYTQINYARTPQKVANLEYAGFFKWLGNRQSGIPGFVMVDPVNNTAEYREFAKPMRYVESGYFGDDLLRAIRFSYPTKILGTPRFEIDEEMNPVYTVPCYSPKVGAVGAMDVTQVILFNPVDGSSKLYDLEDTPAWIDIVFDGNLASEKYNWKGTLSGGFFNSIIGNKDCKQTTDDFGYIVIGDDVWYYTGVTSVNSDKSNIGFIVSNARTGDYKFYPVIGAEEHSAMNAAEGEVQEKGYVASFPALINLDGQPTYIMVLKDAGGLVKLYALVNVEQYSIVATGTTQEKAMEAYRALLIENELLLPPAPPVLPEQEKAEYTVTVSDLRIVNVGEGDMLYIGSETEEGVYRLFRADLKENEALLLLRVGDTVTLTAAKTEIEHIYAVLPSMA